jgi:hypothetical protein
MHKNNGVASLMAPHAPKILSDGAAKVAIFKGYTQGSESAPVLPREQGKLFCNAAIEYKRDFIFGGISSDGFTGR